MGDHGSGSGRDPLPLSMSRKLVTKDCYSFNSSAWGEVTPQVIGSGFIVNLAHISATRGEGIACWREKQQQQ